jgi:hypothetical protein
MHRSAVLPALAAVALCVSATSTLIESRDGASHAHMHGPLEGEPPLPPAPPSYFAHDWWAIDGDASHPGLIITHSVLMSIAFFILLPVGKFPVLECAIVLLNLIVPRRYRNAIHPQLVARFLRSPILRIHSFGMRIGRFV